MNRQIIKLLNSIDRSKSILFYPSSCGYHEEFQSLPFDTVILNSRSFRISKKIGKVICTGIDNNALLGLFKKLNIEVSDIVIIRDGCCEGGNYECCASNTFLGKVVGIQKTPFNVSYCHVFSNSFNLPAQIDLIAAPEYVKILRLFSNPHGEQKGISIKPMTLEKKEFQLGRIKVGICQESIVASLDNYDVIAIPSNSTLLRSFENFAKGMGVEHQNLFYRIESETPEVSFTEFLELAKSKKWQKLAVLPFGRKNYRGVLSAIENHNNSKLHSIDFFHLHNFDYRQIYKIYQKSNF